jgi:hypothetical protein
MKIASFLYQKLLAPRLSDEDGKRQEFILNILLVSLSVLFLVLSLQIVFAMFFDPGKTGASPFGALTSFFLFSLHCLVFLVLDILMPHRFSW